MVARPRRARVAHDDFDASVMREGTEALSVPSSLEAPRLLDANSWYAAPVEQDAISGVHVAVEQLLGADSAATEVQDSTPVTGGVLSSLILPAGGAGISATPGEWNASSQP